MLGDSLHPLCLIFII